PPPADGRFGRDLVEACERIAGAAMPPAPSRPRRAPAKARSRSEVAIIGGTGFIGTHVVRRFLREGARVSVLARNTRNLPPVFDDENVALHAGDIGDTDK